jgi:predicted nucleotidyltransferase
LKFAEDWHPLCFFFIRILPTHAADEIMTLLQQMEHERKERLERLRLATRADLETALRELLPGERVIVFGSLTKPGRFQDASDVDIALEAEPAHLSQYQLIALLAERLGRPVDVVLLPECRLREKIEREGEPWTLPADDCAFTKTAARRQREG